MRNMNISIKPKYITLTLHGLIWGALLSFPLFLGDSGSGRSYVGLIPGAFFTISNVMHIGLFYFNAFYLYPKLLNRKRWWLYLLCIVALVMMINYIKILVIRTWFPELVLSRHTAPFIFFPTVFFWIVSTVYRLILNRIHYERKQKERQAAQLSTELKFLRSQISPHFLFNVLNNMVAMARQKSDLLEPSLIRLSGLMRYMLYESDEKKVPLTQEIDYLKSYIELQKLRFEEDVKITTTIQYEEDSLSIEPMLLIPFVENAFKHGVAVVKEPFINISLKVVGNTLHFSVENKFSREENQSKDKASGIGLANVKARLQLLYPGQHQLSVHEHNEIFSVNLTLPLP